MGFLRFRNDLGQLGTRPMAMRQLAEQACRRDVVGMKRPAPSHRRGLQRPKPQVQRTAVHEGLMEGKIWGKVVVDGKVDFVGTTSDGSSSESEGEQSVHKKEVDLSVSLSVLVVDYMNECTPVHETAKGNSSCTPAPVGGGLRTAGSTQGARTFSCSSKNSEEDSVKVVKDLVGPADAVERKLLSAVEKNLKIVLDNIARRRLLSKREAEDWQGRNLKVEIVRLLRRMGYNAAICRSQWEHSSRFPGGIYEYIDVLSSTEHSLPSERLLVDIDFRSQFEIARPSAEYTLIVQSIPEVFVGPKSRLELLVALMANAAKRSIASTDLQLPPWRKIEYLRAKWLSAHQRISVVEEQSSSGATSPTVSTSGRSSTTEDHHSQVSETSEWSAWSPVVFDSEEAVAARATGESKWGQQASELKVTSINDVVEAAAPEGQVRGGNRLKLLIVPPAYDLGEGATVGEREGTSTSSHDQASPPGSVSPTTVEEWKLPCERKSPASVSRRTSGLAAALMEAGLRAMQQQKAGGEKTGAGLARKGLQVLQAVAN